MSSSLPPSSHVWASPASSVPGQARPGQAGGWRDDSPDPQAAVTGISTSSLTPLFYRSLEHAIPELLVNPPPPLASPSQLDLTYTYRAEETSVKVPLMELQFVTERIKSS